MKSFFYILFLTLFSTNFNIAYAYLDPGTGGFIIQAILGFIAAIIAYCSFYYNKVKYFIKKLFSKKKPNETDEKF
tara:strand:+ start:167 stop:391 length:225 start_codon:yes stop_codon:yes gene_type:complete